MKRVVIVSIIMCSVCSCVSSKKYENLEAEYDRLKQEHSELVDKYDSMAEQYTIMYNDYISSEELRYAIELSKSRVERLKRDVLLYADNNIFELDHDIYLIERALDGWDF